MGKLCCAGSMRWRITLKTEHGDVVREIPEGIVRLFSVDTYYQWDGTEVDDQGRMIYRPYTQQECRIGIAGER